jgi:hypothetical protein
MGGDAPLCQRCRCSRSEQEIVQVLVDYRHLLRIGDRFQIFLELGRFGIRLALDFIDLSQQEVNPGFAPGFVDLRRLQSALLCFGQMMQPEMRASNVEIETGIAREIAGNPPLLAQLPAASTRRSAALPLPAPRQTLFESGVRTLLQSQSACGADAWVDNRQSSRSSTTVL